MCPNAFRLTAFCFAITLTLCALSGRAFSDEALSRLTANSNRVQNIKAKWSVTQTHSFNGKNKSIVSEREIEFRTDKSRYFYKVNGSGFDEESKEVRDSNFVTAFDGTEGRLLFDKVADRKGNEYPHGFVSTADEVSENSNLFPILWAIDPCGKWAQAFSLLQIDVSKIEEISEATCYRSTDGKQIVWIDDHGRIVKVELNRNGRLGDQYLLEYDLDDGSLKSLIPRAWKKSRFSPTGHLDYALSAVLREVAINEGAATADFQVVFPVGSIVTDNKSGEIFLVKGEGMHRPILPDELEYSYDKIASTGTWRVKEKVNWNVMVFLLLLAVAIGVCGRWRMVKTK